MTLHDGEYTGEMPAQNLDGSNALPGGSQTAAPWPPPERATTAVPPPPPAPPPRNELDDTVEALNRAGINPAVLVKLFKPTIDQSVQENFKSLPALIGNSVKNETDRIAERVFAKVNAQADEMAATIKQQRAQEAPPVQQQAPQLPPGAIDSIASNPIAQLFSMIMQKSMGGMGNGEPAGNAGLKQMASLATGWGEVMKAVMQPIAEMQATMRQSVLAEMSTYSKTGGALPWDKDQAPPAPQVPALPRASLNSDAAKTVADRIRLYE